MSAVTDATPELEPAGPSTPKPEPGARAAASAQALRTVGLYVAAIAVALALSALIVGATGGSPWETLKALYEGSLSNGAAWGQSIDQAVPLLLVALGTAVAIRAGLFNIGQEGQLAIGATVATAMSLYIFGPGWLVLLLTLVGAIVGGALWAGIAALMHFTRGVSVVISTLLMVFIAQQVVAYAVTDPNLLGERARPGAAALAQSPQIPVDARIPRLGEYPGFNITSAALAAVIIAALLYLALNRTVWGFKLRMLGLNPLAARRSGVRAAVAGSVALLISGGFAGLAGGVALASTSYRLQPGFSNNIGFQGLLVALVARNNPLAAIPVAFFFGALRAGGGFLTATGVPRYLVDVVTALLVLACVFPPAWQAFRSSRVVNEKIFPFRLLDKFTTSKAS